MESLLIIGCHNSQYYGPPCTNHSDLIQFMGEEHSYCCPCHHTCTGDPLYIISRLFLVILPFTTLRALPPGAFRDVNWSVYIPHLG
ncbi:hypothetical protein B0H17DRAFT_1251330 [Mycena rosella]|uniref:Uncharacterized protein n=1 Tax=Mycena rosella TaxID=1033263 RepID=A0AAD7DW02_MYCRO|nr:hypothetical protein B0H17DRAFT_1251330 [Mycena rosella]